MSRVAILPGVRGRHYVLRRICPNPVRLRCGSAIERAKAHIECVSRQSVLLRSIVVSLLVLLLGGSRVEAFEIDGFRVGMTLAEARAVANRRGLLLNPLPNNPGMFLIGGRGAPQANVTFCAHRDALFAYSGPSVGGFGAFTRMIERETARLGQGQIAASTVESASGPVSVVHVVWREQSWTVSIVANAVGETGPVTTSRLVSAFVTQCRR